MTELYPRDILERTFRRWPLIALGILLGGLAGWLASYLLSPVYESHAEIYINLDSAIWIQENHVGNPTDIAIANSVRPITALFYSDDTTLRLANAARNENIFVDKSVVQNTFTIQRINMTWLMTVRAQNPQTAARLADLWVQAVLPTYPAAYEHALSAYTLTVERDATLACFEGATLIAGNVCAGTSFASLADLQPALATLDARIATERDSSLGLDPAMTIESGPSATVPSEPVHYQRTWLALAGTMIGLILGVTATQITFQKWKKNVRAE
jgi:hypothetical protein